MTNKKPNTARYRFRRRLIIPGAGEFNAGDVAELTEEQYQADRNSLELVAEPPAPAAPQGGDDTGDGTGGDGGGKGGGAGQKEGGATVDNPPNKSDTKPDDDKRKGGAGAGGKPQGDGGEKAGAPDKNKDRMDADHVTR